MFIISLPFKKYLVYLKAFFFKYTQNISKSTEGKQASQMIWVTVGMQEDSRKQWNRLH